MATTNKTDKLVVKDILVAAFGLCMLIPLALIKGQVEDRENTYSISVEKMSNTWGGHQTISGPTIVVRHKIPSEPVPATKEGSHPSFEYEVVNILPRNLTIEAEAKTEQIHRSIYNATVYTSAIHLSGEFVVPDTYAKDEGIEISLGVGDVKGIDGKANFELDGRRYSFHGDGSSSVKQAVTLSAEQFAQAGSDPEDPSTRCIRFTADLSLKGSNQLDFRPYGGLTTVTLKADCPDPSFVGDFLPVERTVTDEGFTAKWVVSELNHGAPSGTLFGARMLGPITQYQQTTRSVKYGILIILLVFLAAMVVEWVTQRSINLVQYLVIGLSLVLFYALLLSFSEFMPFALAYGIAALMTTGALLGYFRAILKHSSAYVLATLVALSYIICYILLQMSTYALLCGTLVLFALMLAVMYFTRDLTRPGPDSDTPATTL